MRPGTSTYSTPKLKREILSAFDAEDDDVIDGQTATFKKADLHKMHAYRDALGASSVWILYPGDSRARAEFTAPWARSDTDSGLQGVGALAVRPGDSNHESLDAIGLRCWAPPRPSLQGLYPPRHSSSNDERRSS